jgi:prepilin-type N-terminal cleavage/methylation domain
MDNHHLTIYTGVARKSASPQRSADFLNAAGKFTPAFDDISLRPPLVLRGVPLIGMPGICRRASLYSRRVRDAHMRPTYTRAAGFSLVELITGMSVFAVLVAIGVPAFTNLVSNQRIATQANSVVGALNYARAEVAARSVPVTVCAASSADRTACGDSTNWQFGWIIFTDRSGNPGVIDGTDEVLQTGEPPVAGFDITASQAYVRFGFRSGETLAQSFVIRPVNMNRCSITETRVINVTATGRVSTAKGPCS